MRRSEKRLSLVYLALLVSLFMVSCDEDLPDGEGLSPSRVCGGMEVESGIKDSGEFPAATSDSQSPVIQVRTETLYLVVATYTKAYMDRKWRCGGFQCEGKTFERSLQCAFLKCF